MPQPRGNVLARRRSRSASSNKPPEMRDLVERAHFELRRDPTISLPCRRRGRQCRAGRVKPAPQTLRSLSFPHMAHKPLGHTSTRSMLDRNIPAHDTLSYRRSSRTLSHAYTLLHCHTKRSLRRAPSRARSCAPTILSHTSRAAHARAVLLIPCPPTHTAPRSHDMLTAHPGRRPSRLHDLRPL